MCKIIRQVPPVQIKLYTMRRVQSFRTANDCWYNSLFSPCDKMIRLAYVHARHALCRLLLVVHGKLRQSSDRILFSLAVIATYVLVHAKLQVRTIKSSDLWHFFLAVPLDYMRSFQ